MGQRLSGFTGRTKPPELFTVGAFGFSSTGVTAFFGAGFAAAFVALVAAIDSSSLVEGWPKTFAFA